MTYNTETVEGQEALSLLFGNLTHKKDGSCRENVVFFVSGTTDKVEVEFDGLTIDDGTSHDDLTWLPFKDIRRVEVDGKTIKLVSYGGVSYDIEMFFVERLNPLNYINE